MYRSVVLFALFFIAVSEGCQPPPCHWSNAKRIEDYYSNVVNVMIQADRNIKNYCNQNVDPAVKEDHKPKQYSLIYPADGDVYEIIVRGRALLVRSENCMGTLVDVRVLPAYVKPKDASYRVEYGKLIITFPYKFDPVAGGGACKPPDPAVITIPQGSG